MSGTHVVVMGDRGRIVVPLELRQRAGLDPGTQLLLVDTGDGIVRLTQAQAQAQAQALDRIRADLQDQDLVEQLLAER